MNIQRIRQLKDIWLNRSDLQSNIYKINQILIKEIWKDVIKDYIKKKIIEEDFSLDDINNLRFKLEKTYGILIPVNVWIYSFFYNFFIKNILLPNYVESWKKEDIFKEIDKIFDISLKKIDKKIEKMNSNWFFNINLWNKDAFESETENFYDWKVLKRNFDVWWIFWTLSIWENIEENKYTFQIPVRIKQANKKRKIWEDSKEEKAIESKKIDEILDKYFLKSKSWIRRLKKSDHFKDWFEKFYIKTEKKLNTDYKFWSDNFSTYYVINIRHDEINKFNNEIFLIEEMINYLEKFFKIWNFLINDIANKSEIKHKRRYYNFTSEIFYDNSNPEDEDDVNNSMIEKFSKMIIEDKNPVYFHDIWGNEKALEEAKKIAISIKNEAIMKSWWSKTTSWILFDWPPWTWKTMIAKAIATEVDAVVYNVKLTDIASSTFINEWANNVKELFKVIRHKAKKSDKKVIVVLDELDALFKKRTLLNQSWEDIKVINTFLTEMWWFDDNSNVIFIGTTNLKEELDEAVIRSWRMSTHIRIDLPDEKARKDIFDIHINKIKKESKKAKEALNWIDTKKIANSSENLSWADIEEIVRIMMEKKAIEEINAKTTEKISKITTNDFIELIKDFKAKRISSSKLLDKLNIKELENKLKDKNLWELYNSAITTLLWEQLVKELKEWITKSQISIKDLQRLLEKEFWWKKMWF